MPSTYPSHKPIHTIPQLNLPSVPFYILVSILVNFQSPLPHYLSVCHLWEAIWTPPTLGSTPLCYSPLISMQLAPGRIWGFHLRTWPYQGFRLNYFKARLSSFSIGRKGRGGRRARGSAWAGGSSSGRKLWFCGTSAERCVKMEVAGVGGCEATVSRGRPRRSYGFLSDNIAWRPYVTWTTEWLFILLLLWELL